MITAVRSTSSKLAKPFRLAAVQRVWGRIGGRRSASDDEFAQILDIASEDASAPRAATEKSDKASEPTVHWGKWRIDLMERLWGKGFLLPGGTEFVHELTKPLSLGSKASVLVLGAGMGGPSNLIAEEFGAFIDGVEPDPELAAASTKRAAVVKGISRVKIMNLTIDDDDAFSRKYDAIFGQEILLKRADKSVFLKRCVNALKDNGKLVITDFTSTDDTAADAIVPWLKSEEAAGPILDESQLREIFTENGFRMRTIEDMTDRYVGLVLDGWTALEESLRENSADREILLGMLEEAERWTQRITLLKSEQIGYTRLFATKKTKF
jgi:cyclopropane fatty-acyl-phospholipid synthase-like methyltransferase